MKKMFVAFLIGAMCLLTVQSYSQEKNIPESVQKHFKSTYPNAVVKDWDHERDGSYEVEFKIDNIKWEAHYDSQGNWIKTERDVKRSEVPQAVWDALAKSTYSTWKVDDIEEHQTPNHKSLYEIELKKSGQKTYIYFKPTGEMIQ